MASPLDVALCAAVAAVFWTCVGLPVAQRLFPTPSLAFSVAPALGWAMFSAAALPLLLLVGFTGAKVATLCAAVLIASIAALLLFNDPKRRREPFSPDVPGWAYLAAALVATAPAVAVMPKFTADGIILAAPIFDHAKVAIVDEITRNGLPPVNPFFGEAGQPSRLAYYYLWHFSAAMLAVLPGISGWEADVALTWFTAFSSLTLMMGFAVWLSERRAAAIWVLLLCLAASLRPVLTLIFGSEQLGRVFSNYPGLGAWLIQAAWAPQHLAAASCVLLAVFLLCRLAERPSPVLVAALACVVAAGFGSSVWVGGVTFGLAAAAVAAALFFRAGPGGGVPLLIGGAAAAVLAAALASPMLEDQYIAMAARGGSLPIALRPYEIFSADFVPGALRRWLDLPSYWILLLVIDFPAIYLAGAVALGGAVKAGWASGPRAAAFGLLTVVSLSVGWLLTSTILNNDLGWRGVLPGVLVLTIFAGIGIARWLAAPAQHIAAATALLLFGLGLPHGFPFIRESVAGLPAASARYFSESPDLWAAVRRHSAADERVGSNPLFLKDLTPWPINISWALLSDRRSCYAGWELVRPFTPMRRERVDELQAFFTKIFSGEGTPEDLREMAVRYDCRLVVVTPADGAWDRDGFAASAYYGSVDERPGKWKLYRVNRGTSGRV